MALSNQTIQNLASAIAPEVIDYIEKSEEYVEFMMEMLPQAIKEKLGPIDEQLATELEFCVMDRIYLKQSH